MAASFDARARLGVVVVELRGATSRFSVSTVRSPPSVRAQFDEALRVASSWGLTSFDVFTPERTSLNRSVLPPPGVRFRWVQARKNWIARREARRQVDRLRRPAGADLLGPLRWPYEATESETDGPDGGPR